MELHTLGVQCEVSAGPSGERVAEGLRTGLYAAGCDAGGQGADGMDDRPVRCAAVEFQFEERRHEPGSKTVLGTDDQRELA